MNPNALAMAMIKQAPTRHPTAACWGLGDAVCLIYLLFLLGRLRFLHFQLMLDCTVSNKWNEFSDLILVLRLLSTSLSDCTAWHRPGWVSSLWSWEARPGIAGGWGGSVKSKMKQKSSVDGRALLCNIWGHGRSKRKHLISSGVNTETLHQKGQQGKKDCLPDIARTGQSTRVTKRRLY